MTQVWQTPVRQLQRVGTSQASASSSRLASPAVERGDDAAAGEGDQRPGSRAVRPAGAVPGGLVGDAGVDRRQRPEQLGVDAGRLDADRDEGLPDVGHERGRAADVGVGVGRNTEPASSARVMPARHGVAAVDVRAAVGRL